MNADQQSPNPPVEATTKIVEILTPLPSEQRQRAISAAMVLLGDPPPRLAAPGHASPPLAAPQSLDGISSRASVWADKSGLTREQLDQVFSIEKEAVDVIASDLPGKGKRTKTTQAYILCGVRTFLLSGELSFTDKDARDLCSKVGCYDSPNHALYIKGFGNLLTGSKDTGWKLTNPGLSEAAKIIKALTNNQNDQSS
jgi:hypothetical protein